MLLLAAVVLAFLLQYVFPLTWPGLDDRPAQIVGIAIGLGGFLLIVWAAFTLAREKTTVMPHQASEKLVISGPYKYRRNPIYVADVMILLGLAELSKNIWLVAAAIAFVPLVTWLAILPEERHLEARFGDDYRDYKQRTRRWI